MPGTPLSEALGLVTSNINYCLSFCNPKRAKAYWMWAAAQAGSLGALHKLLTLKSPELILTNSRSTMHNNMTHTAITYRATHKLYPLLTKASIAAFQSPHCALSTIGRWP